MSRLRYVTRLAAISLTALGMVACSADIDSQSENATDSWSNPTPHGDFQFGVSNPASFTDEQRFHTWTFELTDEAEVELRTELFTTNLDSVMYLYKAGTSRYVAKNDDHEGSPASLIKKTLEAGTYTIKIRAVKTFQTGAFQVHGTCNGAGCPVVEPGACIGDGPMSMPAPTSYTSACEDALYDILLTPSATAPAECGSKLEDRAVAFYKEYWDDIYSYEEMSGGEEPSVSLDYKPGVGAVVQVDLGGDEDAMDFVFDRDGKLIHYYQHNQSPDWAWFCGEGEALPEPDEDCFRDIVYNSGYDVSDVETVEGSVSFGDDLSALPKHVQVAIDDYGQEHLSSGTTVEYSYDRWSGYYVEGAEVALSSSERQHMTYVVVGDADYGMRITYVTDEDGTSLVCSEI